MPTQQELLDLHDWMSDEWIANHDFDLPIDVYASAVLQTWGNPKPNQPIKAMFRLPSKSDLEAKVEYCWWWNSEIISWQYCDARHADLNVYTHWLPYYAFPIPEG